MLIISTLLTLAYLFRAGRHIALRTNWYIAILILFFFLTSSYDKTYLDFLSNFNLLDLSFSGFNNLLESWFSGNPTALILVGLLFILTKSSMNKLSINLINENLLLTFGISLFLYKNLEIMSSLPIIFSLILSNILHIYRNENYLKHLNKNFKNFFINNFSLNLLEKLRLIFGLLFIIIVISQYSTQESLGFLSADHILRILFAIGIIFFGIFSNFSLSKRVLKTLIPITIVYLGLILSSVISFSDKSLLINPALSLECMTSVAFLPLIEVLINKYYLIGKAQEITLIRIPSALFKSIVKLITLFIVITYLFYLFTQ